MKYLLDSNILLHIVRGKRAYFLENFGLNDPSNKVFTSVVSVGEMRSFSLRNKWGESKRQILETVFNEFPPIDINIEPILNHYAQIDAFCQNKLDNYPLIGSARKMGKNDLWIAASASAINATLITTDKDFDHLDPLFFRVVYIEPSLIV